MGKHFDTLDEALRFLEQADFIRRHDGRWVKYEVGEDNHRYAVVATVQKLGASDVHLVAMHGEEID